MKFRETELPGAWLVESEPVEDTRGHFARTFCEAEFSAHGLVSRFVQCNVSYNRLGGTIRGLHFQAAPDEETKLVRCTRGRAFDVIVDVRENSPTYGRWTAVELSAAACNAIYIPGGFAHGFQSLEDGTELFYQMSESYRPASSRGLRWNDPSIAIRWPLPVTVISERDENLPFFSASGNG